MRPEYGYALNAARSQPTNVTDVAAVLGVADTVRAQVLAEEAARGGQDLARIADPPHRVAQREQEGL